MSTRIMCTVKTCSMGSSSVLEVKGNLAAPQCGQRLFFLRFVDENHVCNEDMFVGGPPRCWRLKATLPPQSAIRDWFMFQMLLCEVSTSKRSKLLIVYREFACSISYMTPSYTFELRSQTSAIESLLGKGRFAGEQVFA